MLRCDHNCWRQTGHRKGHSLVILGRYVRRAVAGGIAAAAAFLADPQAVLAQGRLEAAYRVTLGSLPFGKGTWTIDVREAEFTASATGTTAGLARLFSRGQGASSAHGTLVQGQPATVSYTSSIQTDRKYDEIQMLISGGVVKELTVDPPSIPTPDRVPLAEAHRRGVADPMTATLIRVAGTGDVFAPDTCKRKLSIFDGRMRYDLRLSFKRLDKVRAEKGYQGTAVVCAVFFSPVAGYTPQRAIIRYLVDQRDMEIWLAPIAGTRLMVPFRASIPTSFGAGILEATQFVSTPYPAAAASNSVKH
jgi:Protein of unknown function (DUF3108)